MNEVKSLPFVLSLSQELIGLFLSTRKKSVLAIRQQYDNNTATIRQYNAITRHSFFLDVMRLIIYRPTGVRRKARAEDNTGISQIGILNHACGNTCNRSRQQGLE